jgi:hypothetical protein
MRALIPKIAAIDCFPRSNEGTEKSKIALTELKELLVLW